MPRGRPVPPVSGSAEEYVLARAAELSRATVVWERSILGPWQSWVPVPVEEATRAHAVAYRATWGQYGWTVRSQAHRLSVLRRFHAWLCDSGRSGENPWAGQRVSGRLPRRLPRVLTPGEMDAMEAACRDDADQTRGLRDLAVLRVLRASGCRSGEVAGLRVEDLDLDRGEIIVRGKNDAERVAFLDRPAVDALSAWLRRGRPRWTRRPAGSLFIYPGGRAANNKMVTGAVERAARGLRRHVHPHLYRHTFATAMLHRGVDVLDLQGLLGHLSLAATARYTHAVPDRLRAAYRRAHGD
jgi:site-specific recombinase XerD